MRLGRVVLAAMLLPAGVSSAQVATEITRDGSFGDASLPLEIEGAGGVFEIGEGLGERAGSNLFHSFLKFDLDAGDTARFTADPTLPTDNVISRVTGGEISQIHGTLASAIGEQNFVFINPSGLVFGPDARIDVSGAFFASTADQLVFDDGTILLTGGPGSVLTTAAPQAFGFLGGETGAISVEGILETRPGRRLGLVGGDLAISGTMSAPDGDVLLVSVDSEGTVRGPFEDGSPALEGFERLGWIEIVDDAIVNSSGLSPTVNLFDLDPVEVNVGFGEVIFAPFEEVLFGDILLGDVVVQDTTLTAYLRPQRADGAGNVFVRGQDLLVRNSDIRSVTAGGSGGAIDVDLSGDLTIDGGDSPFNAGLLARSGGIPFAGTAEVNVGDVEQTFPFEGVLVGAGDGGDITVRAENVTLRGGGLIAASSLSRGAGGSVEITARGSIDVSGRGPNGSSAIFTNAQGTGDAGSIRIEGDELTMRDGGEVIAQTTFDGDAGDIDIDVARLTLLDDSQIDTSTSATLIDQTENGSLLTTGGRTSDVFLAEVDGTPILRRPTELEVNPDPTALDLIGPTRGRGGDLRVSASESILISGRIDEDSFARVSTFALERSVGAAGTIEVTTPSLELADGGVISVTTRGAGASGDIELDIAALTMRGGAEISATSTARGAELPPAPSGGDPLTPGAAGSIELGQADGVHRLGDVLLSASSITTRAEEGPPPGSEREGNITLTALGNVELRDRSGIVASVGSGLGGSVTIGDPQGLVLRESAILARAEGTGQGGRVEITSGLVFADPSSEIRADAGEGVDGEVIINSPVSSVEGNLAPIQVPFLDAAALLRPACAARATGAAGSFTVARRKGLAASPEGLLLAFDDLGRADGSLPDVAAGGTPPATGGVQLAKRTLAEGDVLIRGGRSQEAEAAFTRAWALSKEGGDPARASDALRGVARSQQVDGRFAESVPVLEEALRLAEETGDSARIASALGSLGNAFLAVGNEDRAEELLSRGLQVAKASQRPDVAATVQNNLGNQQAALREHARALRSYEDAAAMARLSGQPVQEAIALSNAARSALELGEAKRSRSLLDEAMGKQRVLPADQVTIYVGIHLAKSYERLAEADAAQRDASLRAANAALGASARQAGAIGDDRALSYALGNLGALYEAENRSREALFLTRRALVAADRANAPDSLYRWYWQEGRLLWSQGKASAALDSYRRAVQVLEETRQEVQEQYGSASVNFRRAVAPVYLDYVEALLSGSDLAPANTAARKRLLLEARATMEQFKAAELRDYFSDECVAEIESRETDLDRVAQSRGRVGVVYPIVLPDRLELLVSLPEGLSRYTVPAGSAVLESTVERYRLGLLDRASRSWKAPAKQLHDWLVAPMVEDLVTQKVATLVFVPDGALRSIPMAALWDGERFLVQRYALAVTPGLSLVDPKPLDAPQATFLLAGVSESREGFSALPMVPEELEGIRALYGGEMLLDEGFESERFATAVATGEPSVVHLASHAVFTGDPSTSFLLTHDGRLTLDRMSEVVAPTRYRSRPLELLVLSACETAAGDERAALGLAGVAIRSGARSALGSLWSIADEAAYRLVGDFYAALEDPDITKAEALRRGQLALLESPEFDHPFYWSPFLLISNWL